MRIGYARVSTEDQKLDLQTAALQRARCDRIFTDLGLSGQSMARPGLNAALKTLRRGDTLVVWRLDRLGRSLMNLVQVVEDLGRRGIDFMSLTEAVDTTSPGGRLVFHMMAALAEFERNLISERTRAGMNAARDKGRHLGRPPALSDKDILSARVSVCQRGEDLNTVAARFRVSPRTMRKWLASGRPGPKGGTVAKQG